MTPLEDKIRTAIRQTAGEIPGTPPPLRLSRRSRPDRPSRRNWVAPLAAAALVVGVIATSVALTRGVQHKQPAPPASSTQAWPGGLPPYYVALTTRESNPDVYTFAATAAEVRSTATGAVIATVVPPKPYVAFTGVTAAADDRTFVLSAQEPQAGITVPRQRFLILRIDPASPARADRASLQALPDAFVPAGIGIGNMALSPDGTLLAAAIGVTPIESKLYVFDLATGSQRTWSYKYCGHCLPQGGGLGTGGVQADALSWTADQQHIALIGPGKSMQPVSAVRLLDIRAPGTNLVANSKIVVTLPESVGTEPDGAGWRGAIITPDGRSVLAIEEIADQPGVHEQLAELSAATGKVTTILNNLTVTDNYEQVLYTNDTGNVLVIAYARGGDSAGILRGDKYTPIRWSSRIASAAW